MTPAPTISQLVVLTEHHFVSQVGLHAQNIQNSLRLLVAPKQLSQE